MAAAVEPTPIRKTPINKRSSMTLITEEVINVILEWVPAVAYLLQDPHENRVPGQYNQGF